tara:strand:- start:142 stop:780 length:639 start_codon:yes stop_codon:yes gene_type:complete
MNIDNLNLDTGDIILFSNKSQNRLNPFYYLSLLIDWGTHSNLTHVGMVVKNPKFLENHNTCEDGLYFWESSWEGLGIKDANDNKSKLGVQLVPLKDILYSNKNACDFYVRKLNNHSFETDNLKKINDIVYNKPYDLYPKDWCNAFLRRDPTPQKINSFWCSALVGYIYTKLGILKEDTDWCILTPDNFSLTGENLNFINEYGLLEEEFKIIF